VTHRTEFAILIGLLTVIPGCGTKPTPAVPMVNVAGRVLDASGKPIANMMLTFNPEDASNQGKRPMALVDANGKFQTQCIPGKYSVTLNVLPHASGHATDPNSVVAVDKGTRGPGGFAWDVQIPNSPQDDMKLQVR
jgi:hypothetical protein